MPKTDETADHAPARDASSAGGSHESKAPSMLVSGVTGVLLAVFGLWIVVLFGGIPIAPYDEGILLTHSWLMRSGALPHRDFYSNYPPGIYLLINAIWNATGVSPLSIRLLGMALHVLLAMLAGRLAGRALGRGFSFIACGLVLVWLMPLNAAPYAWLAAMTMALLAVALALRAIERSTSLFYFAAGVAWTAISCFRHDLFVFFSAAMAAFMLLRRSSRPAARFVWMFCFGAVIPLLLIWVPLLAQAGWQTALNDLILDQARYVAPSRRLPLPMPPMRIGDWPLYLMDPLSVAVLLSLLMPPLVLACLAFPRVADFKRPAVLGTLVALALASLPHVLARADLYHVTMSLTPAVMLAALLLERLALRVRSRAIGNTVIVAGALWLSLPVAFPVLRWPMPLPRLPSGPPPYDGIPYDESRRAALNFVLHNTRPDEPIYVGLVDHRRLVANEVDFYFFARRTGCTRYLQFDPGLTTRDEVQREMAREMEARRPRAVVLSRWLLREEPNESLKAGSSHLDEYLSRHYEVVGQHGRYRLLWRRAN